MKKGLISSLIASSLLFIGAIFPTIVQADTTTANEVTSNISGVVTTNQMSYLYALNDNKLTFVSNRGLATNTAWFYNKKVTGVDGITYYRVATNEWLGSNFISTVTTNQVNNDSQPSTLIPTGQRIVGNSDSLIYHMPGQQSYKISSKNIVYFDTEQDAINAGYQKAKR